MKNEDMKEEIKERRGLKAFWKQTLENCICTFFRK